MTKTTIYLAKITKATYDDTYVVELEAFSTLEKAEAFMVEKGMIKKDWGWSMETNLNYEGDITKLVVK
jgi:hypothetical protein